MTNHTPIQAATKVSALLKEYPNAIDVLVAASPAFQKLKNPVLRKMFASRVSVEQAARIGGVSSDALLLSLQKTCGATNDANTSDSSGETPAACERPAILDAVNEKDIVVLDVREYLAQNLDPFRTIMKTVKQLHPDQVLHLVNSFEPVPLYDVLGNRGFGHWSEQQGNVWKVYFFKLPEVPISNAAPLAPQTLTSGVIELDVSGLEPPEPMQRILMALASLAGDASLLVHHHREPFLLYDQLKTRGFQWKTDKLAEDRYRILIFRNAH